MPEKIGEQILKPVEDRKHEYERCRTNSHAQHRDACNNVDGIGASLGKKIATGNEEWKVHTGAKIVGLWIRLFEDLVNGGFVDLKGFAPGYSSFGNNQIAKERVNNNQVFKS